MALVRHVSLRLGSCAMRSGRPALVLTSTYDLWVGNTSDNVVNLDAGELFGFSTGNYEEVTFPSSLETFASIWGDGQMKFSFLGRRLCFELFFQSEWVTSDQKPSFFGADFMSI